MKIYLTNIKIPNIETLAVSFQNTTLKYSEHTYMHINVQVYIQRGATERERGEHTNLESDPVNITL